LINRVTPDQLWRLYNRLITTRKLAKDLGVDEKWLSYLFHGRAPTPRKKDLRAARLELRERYAGYVLDGSMSMTQAAEKLYCSYNTMRRAVIKLKETA
jgi:glutathione synthase/RimK-type ligase-like ATP-grasp enzyme